MIHITFLLSAMAVAATDRLMPVPHAPKRPPPATAQADAAH